MQSETPQQAPSTPEAETVSQSNKRRRKSERSPNSVAEQSESSHALSAPLQGITGSSPQRGSSAEMTPSEGAVGPRYTRTGRVSKADKGRRVHLCEDCGKVYTRAEHLRRHQQNHKPGAFPCDVPGCGRAFYREDLLIRHKARHNDPLNPVSRPPTPSSHGSAPIPSASAQSIPYSTDPQRDSNVDTLTETLSLPPASGSGGSRTGSTRASKTYLDINQLPNQFQASRQAQIDLCVGTLPNLEGVSLQWGSSPPHSPTGYNSPTTNDISGLPYFPPHPERVRQLSDASYLGFHSQPYPSLSPASAGSSTVCLPQWSNDPSFQHLSISSGSEVSIDNSSGVYCDGISEQSLFPLTAEYRDFMERQDLLIPTGSPPSSTINLSLDDETYNEDRYLYAFWYWIHSSIPVIHKPTFSLQHTSPLLKAAMLALGAHALGQPRDKNNARIVHERCLKVLKQRSRNGWHTYRLCDMQAIVLVEVYAIFKSRRPPLQFSKHFEDVYQCLVADPEAVNADSASDSPMHISGYLDEFSESTALMREAKSKQRLLVACYNLDQQHATLFGRSRTTLIAGSGLELPFPKAQTSWDFMEGEDQLIHNDHAHAYALQAFDAMRFARSGQSGYDTFQSMFMLACLVDPDIHSASRTGGYGTDHRHVPSMLEQTLRVELAYNTFMLCKHTPVRDLLAVAGESWVMAEKMGSIAEFTASQIETREWACGRSGPSLNLGIDEENTPVQEALTFALRILEIHQSQPKTGLLFQEWAIYLASVVIWAKAYIMSMEPQRGPRLSVPNPAAPRIPAQALEQTLSAVIAAGPDSLISMEEATSVLLWTKSKIELVDMPHNCGITNGALDVLGKLVTRGSEEGWFGA